MIIKLLRFVAIIIFDLLDKHLHQNRIKKFIRVNQIDIDFCIDVEHIMVIIQTYS